MPFRSKAQMRYLFSQEPKIAARWEDKYGISPNLPEHVNKPASRPKSKYQVHGHRSLKVHRA